MRDRLPRHANEPARRAGVGMVVAGLVLFLMPALPVDHFSDAHEVRVLAQWTLWLRFSGMAVLVGGNLVRLWGVQGHFGLPWPLFGRGISDELRAAIQVRRRALENRRKALAVARAPGASSAR